LWKVEFARDKIVCLAERSLSQVLQEPPGSLSKKGKRWIEEGIVKEEPELEDLEYSQPFHIVKRKNKKNEKDSSEENKCGRATV